MNSIDLKKLLLGTTLISGFAVMTAAPTFAQDNTVEPIITTVDNATDEDEDENEIVVTGSRLKKDTFQSIVPLQVIDTEIAAEQGLLNPVEILQTSSVAGGTQIDSTFQGFVLDNGPGSETVDLRGLGANRTLVLINGRRVAPAGVEGAPTQPSINLIPSTMVDSFDLLTDGASSVYGSDAVAGVVNVILKNDYDGLEITANADAPEQGGGEDYTIGARYGINGDRGFIGGAIEYDYQDSVSIADRDFLSGCETYREITADGEIRTVNQAAAQDSIDVGLSYPVSECRPTRLTQRFIVNAIPNAFGRRDGFGSIYYQPGIGNSFIPGFSESSIFGVPVDGDGDGVTDVAFNNFSPNGQQAAEQNIINEQKLWSGMVNGELVLEGSMNATPYFEALYADLETEAVGGQPQLFPFVSSNNPFNPCNINQPNGVDCGAAYNTLLSDPGFGNLFRQVYGVTPASFPFIFAPEGVSLSTRPVIGVRGDRNSVATELQQIRVSAGIKGDLPFINSGNLNDWSFDLNVTHSVSDGNATRTGIRGDRLNYALGNDIVSGAPIGNAPCAPIPGLDADLTAGCVPVNLFAPSLYANAAGGDFATQAERNYVFDTRDFATNVSQTVVDGIVQGDVFTLPGGDASLLMGFQIREDTLDSQPDTIAADGLFFGFFSDQGAVGERTTKELYAEAFLPLGNGKPFWREFNVELAGRLTDDEFYGTNETYSVKAGYRPVDSLLLRATLGTSFRAPNLRELFLKGQTGFLTVGDPCAVPDVALGGLQGNGYNRADDPRTDITLNNCRAAGLDPTTFLANQFSSYSVESSAGGSLNLDPETSDSYTLGMSFDQPFTDAFELDFGVTYYSIDIKDTVVEPGAGFIVADCYRVQPDQTSPFCNRIERDFNDPVNPGVIDFIDQGFINRDGETAKGFDINARFLKSDIAVGDKTIDFGINAQFNHMTEREFRLDDAGTLIVDDFVGEFGFPAWRGFVSPTITLDRWRAAWTVQYIDGVEIDLDDQVDLGLRESDADGNPGARIFDNFISGANTVTCGGSTIGDVDCRPIVEAPAYWEHAASISYRADDWSALVGVSNVFDTRPPLVDPGYVFSVSNIPIGNGYDLNGREFFVRLNKRF